MLKKRKYNLVILIISCLLLFTGCSVRKNVRNKEVKEFTKSILESNERVKDLSFYFLRPSLYSDLVYDGDLEKEDFQSLIDEFNKKIDIEFMQRIGDKYWGGSRPSRFNLHVHVDKNRSDKKKHTYDYKISSQYNKTFVHDEEPDNIDGYETWHISGRKDSGIIIDLAEDGPTDTWGIQLSANNITPTGITLECKQLDGEATGDLQTGSYYFLEEEINGEWIKRETLTPESGIAWDDMALIITMNDTVMWNIDWEWLYGVLEDGSYRIGKEVTDFRDIGDYDTKTYYANFQVVN